MLCNAIQLSPLSSSLTHSVFLAFWQILFIIDLFLTHRTGSTGSHFIHSTSNSTAGDCDALQLDVAQHRTSRPGHRIRRTDLQITLANSFRFGNPDIFPYSDILAIVGYLPIILAMFSLCMPCAETPIFELSVKNSDIVIKFSNPDFLKRATIWRSYDVFRCFYGLDGKSAIFLFQVYLT